MTTMTTMTTPLLDIVGLTRRYGEHPHEVVALESIDFSVAQGEMVAIMGPSGSGKSTLLTIAGGLERATSGSIRLGTRYLEKLSPSELAEVRRRDIGFVFQGFNLLVALTAVENIAAPLELDGIRPSDAREQAMAQLRSVGLGDRADAFPDDLSGGERQRVAIARGLVGERTLLLADEPTGALDSATGNVVMELLRSACTSTRGVVVVTHDPNVASWADRVVSLLDGNVASTYQPAGAR